jgi:hypothetical protein
MALLGTAGSFDLAAIMRAAHATVNAQRAGLLRGAAAGYSMSRADLDCFDYRKRFARALSTAWAEAKAARSPHRTVDAAEYASSFTAWAGERGRFFVSLAA